MFGVVLSWFPTFQRINSVWSSFVFCNSLMKWSFSSCIFFCMFIFLDCPHHEFLISFSDMPSSPVYSWRSLNCHDGNFCYVSACSFTMVSVVEPECHPGTTVLDFQVHRLCWRAGVKILLHVTSLFYTCELQGLSAIFQPILRPL